MQPPFFHRDFPAAMNFGGIGMVMGHELTHGFDDSGRKFDPKGRMVEWWEPEVAEKFEQAAECIATQYDGYEIDKGLFLNGRLTLGENIADNGGIKEAFRAYQAWLAENGGREGFMDGMTDEQLFFVGFAQTWCTLATPEIEQMLATVDTHSHPRFRVNGPVSNFPEFAQAFECVEGTPMNPVDKCEVW
jgi:endothelin-converting enzyme/putative endopeptidase